MESQLPLAVAFKKGAVNFDQSRAVHLILEDFMSSVTPLKTSAREQTPCTAIITPGTTQKMYADVPLHLRNSGVSCGVMVCCQAK